MTAWGLWRNRNQVLQKQLATSKSSLILSTETFYQQWMMAQDSGLPPCSEQPAEIVTKPKEDNSYYGNINNECKSLLNEFGNYSVRNFVRRSASQIAHRLGQPFASMSGPCSGFHQFPNFISDVQPQASKRAYSSSCPRKQGEVPVPAEKKGAGSVKILTLTNVKPKKPIGKKECQLVTFDLPYLSFYYIQKLLIYKGAENFDEIVGKLKDGLELVLEEFYQLAGKLDKDEDGVFKVVYDDDMNGVEVVTAAAEEMEVAELTAEEGTSKFKELLPHNGILNLEGLQRPLLAVQLTKLKDGLAMGCAFNHAILDGTSMWHFMSSWAEICNGATSVSVPPFLERTKAHNTRVKLNLSQTTDVPEHAKSATNGDVAAKSSDPPLRDKVFKFSESTIDRIKSKVNANNNLSKPFSTFQSLSAHVWKAVTWARGLGPEDYTVYTVFADCRKRVDPPMPESYFGNLIQAIFAVSKAGLILSNPVEFGAGMIRTSIESHNAEAINKRIEEWESKPIIFQYKDAGVNSVVVGSSPRFKVYGVDFGWGGPESVRSGLNNRFDGMVYLFPGKSGGRSIDVEISLEGKAMERLEKDKEFLMEA